MTSLITHACLKMLGLDTRVSILTYQLLDIQEMTLNKYEQLWTCLETIWLVSKHLGEKPNFGRMRGLGESEGRGEALGGCMSLLRSIPIYSSS